MPVYKANAIVLRRIPLGETDKILTLFTREYGKLGAVAKGARRTVSRLSGATEPLMFVRALIADGMNLDVVTQAEMRESFPVIRANFGLFLRATYACELLDKVTEDRDPAPDAFDLLLSTLYILQRALDHDAAIHAFELKLMALIGYEPQLDACMRCDREVGVDLALHVGAYSPIRGGVICDECAEQAREDLLPVHSGTIEWMKTLANEESARALAAFEMPPLVTDEMNRTLRAHLRYRLERDVRSTAFLDAYRTGAMDELVTVDAGVNIPTFALPTRG